MVWRLVCHLVVNCCFRRSHVLCCYAHGVFIWGNGVGWVILPNRMMVFIGWFKHSGFLHGLFHFFLFPLQGTKDMSSPMKLFKIHMLIVQIMKTIMLWSTPSTHHSARFAAYLEILACPSKGMQLMEQHNGLYLTHSIIHYRLDPSMLVSHWFNSNVEYNTQ